MKTPATVICQDVSQYNCMQAKATFYAAYIYKINAIFVRTTKSISDECMVEII